LQFMVLGLRIEALVKTRGERAMSERSPPRFAVGDKVRVRPGARDPEYPDMPLDGWVGTVSEIHQGSYLVRWSSATLKAVHPIYRIRCERDGVDFGGMWLQAEELEPDPGGPLRIEQPTKIATDCPPRRPGRQH